MRKTLAVLVCTAVLGALPAQAGEIYGKLTDGNAPVGEGVAVQVTCGGKTFGPAKTDKTGSYHLVAADGKCTLSVAYKNQSPSLEIVSYADGAQLDLVLEAKDGKYTLRRK